MGLFGRYVRPDGPWMGGPEPTSRDFLSVQGSGALPLLVAVGVLAGCVRIGRRRRWVDVVALATLALVLVIGAVPAAAQIPVPNEIYYMQWLKVIGGIVWFTAAWTGWRLVEPAVRSVPARRAAATALAAAVILVDGGLDLAQGVATVVPPLDDAGEVVSGLESQLVTASLPRGRRDPLGAAGRVLPHLRRRCHLRRCCRPATTSSPTKATPGSSGATTIAGPEATTTTCS